jgi:hypothetical protein
MILNEHMKVRYRLFSMIFLVIVSACGLDSDKSGISISSLVYDFNSELYGWQYGFSEYPVTPDDSTVFEFKYAHTDRPSNLAGSGKAIMISGNNKSDDLFMFLKKKITGLRPDADYTLSFTVEFASEANPANANIGGPTGENVFMKVGAADKEPKSIVENGHYVMNISKGNRNESGASMINVGNISAPQNATGYALVVRSNATAYGVPFEVSTNSNGELWLIVGTDSSYKGVTTLYYTKINVVLSAKE